MTEIKKSELEKLTFTDYYNKMQLVSEKHKMLLSDLFQSPGLKNSLTHIEKRPGLLTGALSAYDLENRIKDILPKLEKKDKLE